MLVLSAAEMREAERVAIHEMRIPARTLMENAGRAVADRALKILRAGGGGALVVCGAGNNGGDGLVAARHLFKARVPVQAVMVGEANSARLSEDTRANLEHAAAAGLAVAWSPEGAPVAVEGTRVVVDALFGTGLARPVEGAPARAVAAIGAARAAGAKVIAVDMPSGLSSDTGQPLGACVEADATVTFAALKRGLVVFPGAALAGEVEVAEIGIPEAALERAGGRCTLAHEAEVRASIPARPAVSQKGQFGHVLVLAGSPGKTGAAALVARGALRGGAGLVTLCARPMVLAAVMPQIPELMGLPLAGEGPLGEDDARSLLARAAEVRGPWVLAAGPGLWRGPRTAAALGMCCAAAPAAVLDADALNAFAEEPAALGDPPPGGRRVVTPHPGEAARLLGRKVEDRFADVVALAECTRSVAVLKGARSLVAAPGGRISVNPTGNAGMSTAGTGDVLCGLAAALLGQGLGAFEAARAAVFVHGLAGDRAVARVGKMGQIAGDLVDELGGIWAGWGL